MASVSFLALSSIANAQPRQQPALVLQITIDQLRGDLPTRYYDRLGKGGFRYLWERGTVFTNAHHAHANNETVVGHATLATGAHPADHGMIANVWFDRATGHTTYNIEDSRYRLLTAGADVDASTEIDPTQRAARSEGRSPAALLVNTFSDQLAIHTGGGAKIFGVSVKDRGAVTMAGHAGKAFWFSKANGEFVTSSYYYDQYPAWVVDFNKQRHVAAYGGASWSLLHDRSTYLFGESDDRPWEADLAGYGRTFPHPFGPADGKYFTTLLTISPVGDQLTLDFAKQLVLAENLGDDAIPDYLSVSLSSTDYIGHLFGPSSLEAEDYVLRLDRALADFFEFIDKNIGLKRTLIVLSADHGSPEVPGYLHELGVAGGYVKPEQWNRAAAMAALQQKFGVSEELIDSYSHPYVYLNHNAMATHDLDPALVEAAVAEALTSFEGVHMAVSSTALRQDSLPNTRIHNAVRHNFNPERSGDIYVVFKPNWFINDFDGLKVASTHGSPWRYDSFVPIVFAGSNIRAQKISRPVQTVDVAPTLSAILQTTPPSGAVGEPLREVIER
jgi:predicted AlkP superfamily pyrophosphatase or phosphodiesterase